jgi:hypothetical protein
MKTSLSESFADEVASFIREFRGLRAAFLRVRQILGLRLVPRRRKRPAQARDPHNRLSLVQDFDEGPVVDVMEIRRQIAGGDDVEVVVVAVDPVDAGAERLVTAVLVGNIADAEPEWHLGVPRDDGPGRVERAVDVP